MAGAVPKIIASEEFAQALADAGVISDLNTVRRVVIDAQAGHVVLVYVERYGDERLLRITQALEGVEISGVPANRETEAGSGDRA